MKVTKSAPGPHAPAASDDAELVRRALARDDTAFRTIMERYNRRLYRIARGILRNDSEAEDVVQEAYVKAFTHLGGFRGDSSLATWLARITMNEAFGRYRGHREPPRSSAGYSAGIVEYYCRFHPNMKGRITITLK